MERDLLPAWLAANVVAPTAKLAVVYYPGAFLIGFKILLHEVGRNNLVFFAADQKQRTVRLVEIHMSIGAEA